MGFVFRVAGCVFWGVGCCVRGVGFGVRSGGCCFCWVWVADWGAMLGAGAGSVVGAFVLVVVCNGEGVGSVVLAITFINFSFAIC